MGGCCSSIAAAAGIQVPEISEDQMTQIFTAIGQEIVGYAPKFSIAYCSCLCKENQKHMEKVKVDELTNTSIKLADSPDFDPTTVAPPKKHHEEEEEPEENDEEDKEPEQDLVDGMDINATSKTVCSAVFSSCDSIRSDLLSKAGQSEVIAGPVVDRAMNAAIEASVRKALLALAKGITAEWRKLVKKGKDPKKVFLRAQALAKAMKDIKAFIDDMEQLKDDVDDGASIKDIASDAKTVGSDGKDLKEDRENLKKMQEEDDKKKNKNRAEE